MVLNPHQVTKDFESAVADYCDSRYCVAVNSCTMALLLSCAWFKRQGPAPLAVSIPKKTYVGVPMSIRHAGFRVTFRDEAWLGSYQLQPLPVWDSARLFTAGMHVPGTFTCVSFHASKTLGIEQGGAILHDDPAADAWLRRMRFDGRTPGVAPKDDHFTELGWHCYMNPGTAAQGLMRLHALPRVNAPLPNDDYPDLSQCPVFD